MATRQSSASSRISRGWTQFTRALIAASGSTNTANDVSLADYCYGSVILPTGVTGLTFYSVGLDGTAYPLSDGTAAVAWSGRTANQAYPLPDEIAGVAVLRVVPNANGTVEFTLKG